MRRITQCDLKMHLKIELSRSEIEYRPKNGLMDFCIFNVVFFSTKYCINNIVHKIENLCVLFLVFGLA